MEQVVHLNLPEPILRLLQKNCDELTKFFAKIDLAPMLDHKYPELSYLEIRRRIVFTFLIREILDGKQTARIRYLNVLVRHTPEAYNSSCEDFRCIRCLKSCDGEKDRDFSPDTMLSQVRFICKDCSNLVLARYALITIRKKRHTGLDRIPKELVRVIGDNLLPWKK
jgi:hypothetical protein